MKSVKLRHLTVVQHESTKLTLGNKHRKKILLSVFVSLCFVPEVAKHLFGRWMHGFVKQQISF